MHQEARAAGAVTTFFLGCLAVGLAVLVILQPPPGSEPAGTVAEPAPAWAPAIDAPVAAADPGSGISQLVDSDWAASTAAATGIPERAVLAYAGAAIVKANAMPGCGLSWNTIAAIGAMESDHGRHDGSVVADDGTVSPAIYGIALDGVETGVHDRGADAEPGGCLGRL